MIEIGGNKFDVPQPKGMQSWSLQQRILPVAGRVANVFLRLLGAGDMGKLLEADVLRVLPQALPYVGQIFSEMPAGELEAITRTLLQEAKVSMGKGAMVPLFNANGGEDVFDDVMRGRSMDTWKLLWHALEVWYPDFFTRVRSSFGKSAKASRSEESTDSFQSGPAGA